jgi:hypothetical protein
VRQIGAAQIGLARGEVNLCTAVSAAAFLAAPSDEKAANGEQDEGAAEASALDQRSVGE